VGAAPGPGPPPPPPRHTHTPNPTTRRGAPGGDARHWQLACRCGSAASAAGTRAASKLRPPRCGRPTASRRRRRRPTRRGPSATQWGGPAGGLPQFPRWNRPPSTGSMHLARPLELKGPGATLNVPAVPRRKTASGGLRTSDTGCRRLSVGRHAGGAANVPSPACGDTP
jgi:hypothetical protein